MVWMSLQWFTCWQAVWGHELPNDGSGSVIRSLASNYCHHSSADDSLIIITRTALPLDRFPLLLGLLAVVEVVVVVMEIVMVVMEMEMVMVVMEMEIVMVVMEMEMVMLMVMELEVVMMRCFYYMNSVIGDSKKAVSFQKGGSGCDGGGGDACDVHTAQIRLSPVTAILDIWRTAEGPPSAGPAFLTLLYDHERIVPPV